MRYLFAVVFIILFMSCKNENKNSSSKTNLKVEFREENGQWTLYRNGEPYFIKGAHGYVHPEWLAEIGGNSMLLYDYQLSDSLLDVLDSLNLTAAVTLDVGKARFEENDYSDPEFIRKQRQHVMGIVSEYASHPAILLWIIGNEIHIQKRNNVLVWKEVNELSKLIHATDPNHPTTTILAAYPTTEFEPLQIKLFAPDLDFISLTVYEFAPRIKRESDNFIWGTNGPFVVTEWGGTPYWMYPRTEWDAIIESSSTENAKTFVHNYYNIFNANNRKCLGGYVFYWGQKHERTTTVFSLLPDDRYKSQALESLQYLWAGTNPENWCPRIDSFYITGQDKSSTYLKPGSENEFMIYAHDPDNDSIKMKWEIRDEGYYAGKTGGEAERIPEIIFKSDTLMPYTSQINFVAPQPEGQYRLYFYLFDTHKNVATANIPFYVLR